MENASRALVMAGGVLIALLVLGALMLMFNNLSVYQNQQDQNVKNDQIAEFNNQFIPYEKDNLTLMELKSVYNKIESNNQRNPDKHINHNIITDNIYSDIGKKFEELPEIDKQTARFSCTITYKDGYDDKMTFTRLK